MLQAAHNLLMALFIVLPMAMLAALVVRPRARSLARVPSATVAIASSLLLGISASVIYDLWLGGISSPGQMLLTCYWAAGLIGILKLLDLCFDRLTRMILRRARSWPRARRQSIAQLARVILLFSIGLPFMIVAAATYRPRVTQKNSAPWFDMGAASISFESTDGVHLSGFFTTPPPATDGIRGRLWGRQTVIICPGARGGKSAYLNAAGEFLSHGYNVLTFDFRAHGQSDGQLDSFGDHERRDVLGAVRWLQSNHPRQCRRIVGFGIDTGAAALLAAADDPSREGRAIDAIAVLGCYDRFDSLVSTTALPPIMGWLIEPIALPLACVQTGADLWNFSPARAAADIAPRPILFVQSEHDPVITFERGQELFDAASEPKEHIWLENLTDEEAADDPDLISRVRHFLDTAIAIL